MGEGMLLKSLFQLQELQENLRTVKKKTKKNLIYEILDGTQQSSFGSDSLKQGNLSASLEVWASQENSQ